MNTAYHIAAAKTNFQVLYELDKYGANIFIRNKENKTSFQVVNNNLLMLKIVKKLERKYYFINKLPQLIKIHPPEFKLININNILLNSGEYRHMYEILQKSKKDQFRLPPKRNSIFSNSLSRQ